MDSALYDGEIEHQIVHPMDYGMYVTKQEHIVKYGLSMF